MNDLSLLLIAIFLPVFPLSMLFNVLFASVRHPLLRLLLLLGWPFVGIVLYRAFEPQLPEWVAPLALATAVFYAFRLLAMREVGIWTGYIATSAWACLWLPLMYADADVMLYVFWFGVPLAVLALLVGGLEKRYGAAYTELYGGLALSIPRFSGVFVVTVLAVVATPIFPTFFGMLNILVASQPLVAMTLVGLWALWSWAGMRLIQGMVVGDPSDDVIDDMPLALVWGFGVLMLLLIVAGFTLTGDL
jgi:formate hydrogenlyase subunit 3/multisubunit Na+/H+ antiporter MnhD subunit